MRVDLKPFQEIAVEELLTHFRAARHEALRFPQAILLSAPTGAGKTVIVTAMVEALLQGDDAEPPLHELTVLWLTDQPELNEQTRRKMQSHSEILDSSRLVTIEQTFREEVLSPGRVYFLNTQKLGRNSGLVNARDHRPWTLWDTIRDTIAARPREFVVIIDEAHRGMAESEKDREQAQTIAQKFIKGGDDLPPAPLILGLSATPDRFLGMVAGRRNLRPQVDVPPDEVRESGLLKQTLLVYHPTRGQPSDFTLLRAAAERHQDYRDAWAEYRNRAATGESVEPVLVVQVTNAPAGRGGRVTDTDLAMSLNVIEAVLGALDEGAIGHAFQEETAIPVGDGRVVRYVAPSDIQEDLSLRVVFFKTALTTGWDCPRAEVMMSFRRAVDHTMIAQLVGRMVRTPLARTVEDDEFLNTVSLYLPHYDKRGLDKVLHRLQADDPEFVPPIEVKKGADRVRLQRDSSKKRCFEVLKELPTYDVMRIRRTSHARRALKLARLLDRDGITEGKYNATLNDFIKLLTKARRRLEKTEWWRNIVKDAGTIDLTTVEWGLGIGVISEHQALVPITQQNVDDLFAAAGRRLGEGLHKAYRNARVEADADPLVVRRIAKLEIFALSQDRGTEEKLEEFAERAVEGMLAQYGSAIEGLPPDRHEGYRYVRLTARDLQSRSLGTFEHIEGPARGPEWDHHLYVDDEGRFVYKFKSSWEPQVLRDEMSATGFEGWLRIEDRKDWALTIPYRMQGEVRPMYPDFLIFRRVGRRVVADILDPHDPSRDDWVPKVKGLADYASKHWPSFGKIQVCFVEKKTVRRLDLAVERNRVSALQAEGPTALRALFSDH